jgi:hypothetical protein
MILSGRAFLLCVALGAVLGVSMIVTHTGPGLSQVGTASTPRSRDTVRHADISLLAGALAQYKQDHGTLPDRLSSSDTQICTSSGQNCHSMHYADLSFLYTGGNYIEALPVDPAKRTLWASGYTIAQLPDGRIRLSAPKAELSPIAEIR